MKIPNPMVIKQNRPTKLFVLVLLYLTAYHLIHAQETEKIYLSGKDFEHPVTWQFKCSNGNNCNQWSTISVPSNWELQGFGEYTYGRWYKELNLKEPSKEKGFYKYRFNLLPNHKDKHINLVFDGVMTDTEVFLNGEKVGPVHQGGFYRFKYDVSKFLKYGQENVLEVTVSKHSQNQSVNWAERYTDWWLFGGIYRPVWLEILPKKHIAKLKVDAKQDGSLILATQLNKLAKNATLNVSIKEHTAKKFRPSQNVDLNNGVKDTIHTQWKNVKPWSPENPVLYDLRVSLVEKGKIMHTVTERIGFRTLAFIKKDGIYLNGTKLIMKGVNRHSIWPESGRSLSKRISLLDATLIKDMNMNAVRTHYPPAEHFLSVCDSLGILVLDELAGWQNPYDTNLGAKLAQEVLDKDANHPAVIIWDNGNEGGWGPGADHIFKTQDLQKRIVIHPWSDYDGWDTHHYPTYQTGLHRFTNGENVFFPTEFMHSTYDNGGGAGLADFWENYSKSPLFAGGFIWAFVDEAVLRTDWKGPRKYDSAGSLAPDGIVGPHREKEGSYYAIKSIFSPVQIAPVQITKMFKGELAISNSNLFTNLNTFTYTYQIISASKDSFYSKDSASIIHEASYSFPDISPGETRKINLNLPPNFFEGDWLKLTAYNNNGQAVNTFTWPIHKAKFYSDKFLKIAANPSKVNLNTDGENITVYANNISLTLNKTTGYIVKITSSKKSVALTNGPKPIGMQAVVDSVRSFKTDSTAVIDVFYSGAIDKVRWTMTQDGKINLRMTALQKAKTITGFDGPIFDAKINSFGLSFDYPETDVLGFKWFGKGPYRVWKNRMEGVNYGLWEKAYNNTITGESFENLVYPEFKGYHANFYAGTLHSKNNTFRFFSENENTFLRLFTPEYPKYAIKGRSHPQPEFPEGDISFMYEIPAMRSFKPISDHGPNSQPTNIRIKKGDQGITMSLWFDFIDYNKTK
ncbi:glycoside hydrolase family 2 TIM barrel-domain containing protein [Croceivirga radicis]|uniref:glycoside hydrolase family 2 TIM barrel-domain containing protein n=1 Tax=Croceivirga radicis TaxID=1929488 RepID=UPI001ED8ED95|nr:glycoside hydrolase family 2 TIM barrel-domain containing protein [Croceivirga radicis]